MSKFVLQKLSLAFQISETTAKETIMVAQLKMFPVLVLCAFAGLTVLADPPPVQNTSIKELVKQWNKLSEDGTVDDILKVYSAKTDKAKEMSRDMAEQSIAEAKLQKAVRSKWGAEAEQKLAAVCGADTAKDDDDAEEVIKDDHAMLKFKNESMPPLILVKSGGDWKIDCDAYVMGLGGKLKDGEKAMRAITAAVKDPSKELAAGTFPTAAKRVASLKLKLEAIHEGT
jgi:hypothetical protein